MVTRDKNDKKAYRARPLPQIKTHPHSFPVAPQLHSAKYFHGCDHSNDNNIDNNNGNNSNKNDRKNSRGMLRQKETKKRQTES